MAATVNELVEKRSTTENTASGTSHTREFDVAGATDEDDAISSVKASPDAPATLTIASVSLERRSIRLRETEVAGDYLASVEYVEPSKPEKNRRQPGEGETEYSFDLSMPNEIYKVAIDDGAGGFQQKVWPPGTDLGMRPDGVVGVSGSDGTVEGVSFQHTGAGFSLTKVFTDAQVTAAQIETWETLIGTRNLFAFQGFGALKLLLAGIRGQQRNNNDWSVTFESLIDEQQFNVNIGGIPNITVLPFDYVEVFTKEVWLAPVNRVRTQVIAVITSTIFPADDWTNLLL